MPPNALLVQRRDPSHRLSQLSLRHEVVDAGPDWPVVSILVDGRRPFEAVAPGWHGFDPSEVLAADSPLVPHGSVRRVALYRCTCGVAGCGVIAATIERSPDGRRISWTDFADHVGVFDRPLAGDGPPAGSGRPWPLADLHFDAAQYESEVRRLAADGSWETPRRRTARRVRERLEEQGVPAVSSGLDLQWVSPGTGSDEVVLCFGRRREGISATEQVLLHLVGGHVDPEACAAEIVDSLARVDPRRWSQEFGQPARLR